MTPPDRRPMFGSSDSCDGTRTQDVENLGGGTTESNNDFCIGAPDPLLHLTGRHPEM